VNIQPKTDRKGRPKYVSGKQPGWNQKSRRWTGIDGKITSHEKVMRWYASQGQSKPEDAFGGTVERRGENTYALTFPTPITSSFEIVEATMAGAEKGPFGGLANILQAVLKPSVIPLKKRPPDWMPTQVSARMRLSEHYFATEGDASNICSAPIEILAGKPRSVIVESPNAKHRAEVESFLQRIRIDEVIPEIWSSMRVYGQAYPYEIVEGEKFNLQGVLCLSPQNVHRGWDWSYTLSSDMIDKPEWNEELIESHFPDMMYQQMIQHWNDTSPKTMAGLPLDKNYIAHISDRVYMPWWRYAMPMLSLGFRDLTSRTIQEDAIRAVTEGHRYQLWVFKLGSENIPPMPDEVTALKNVLGTMVTERTGTLVWKNPLEIEVHVPKGLDVLMVSGYLDFLTRQFFRKMGFTPRLLTGEAPGVLGGEASGAAGGAKPEIDVQLYLERCRAQEAKIMAWLWSLVDKYLRGTGKPTKDMAKTTFKLAPTDIEMAARIEAIFGPAYRDGVLSERTYLEQMGRNLETEIERKREAKPARDEGLFNPPATFAQQVVNPAGQVEKEVAQTEVETTGTE